MTENLSLSSTQSIGEKVHSSEVGMLIFLMKTPKECEKVQAVVKSELVQSLRIEKPVFPERKAADPARREDRVAAAVKETPDKAYEPREKSVRISLPDVDPAVLLKEHYTNDDGVLVCQLCPEAMPFKKRDVEYYFEAVEAIQSAPKEEASLFLALCPICAARFNEYVKREQSAASAFSVALAGGKELQIPVKLDSGTATIRFVEKHRLDIRTVLDYLGPKE